MHIDQIDAIERLETKLAEKTEEIKKKNEEIELMRKELDEKINHGNQIKELEDQLSAKDAKIQSLVEQLALQDTISYSSSSNDECFDMLTDTGIPPEKAIGEMQCSTSSSCNEDYSDAPPPTRKRSSSDVTELKVMVHVHEIKYI